MTEIRALSRLLVDLRDSLVGDLVRVEDIVRAFHERGFGVMLFFFALPAALPVPAIGLNLIIGAPLVFITVQMALGRSVLWLPETVRRRTLRCAALESFVDSGLPWIRRMEYFVRPRLGFLTRGRGSQFAGLVGVIMALAVCIPLPLTNTVPSFGLALMAVGLIMRDGLAVIAGGTIGIAWITALAVLGQAGIRGLLSLAA